MTRLFALEALSRGPTALVLEGFPGNERWGWGLDFSPDGKWLAGQTDGGLNLWPSTGSAPTVLDGEEVLRAYVRFGPDSERLK